MLSEEGTVVGLKGDLKSESPFKPKSSPNERGSFLLAILLSDPYILVEDPSKVDE
jgi:hypothetical protein